VSVEPSEIRARSKRGFHSIEEEHVAMVLTTQSTSEAQVSDRLSTSDYNDAAPQTKSDSEYVERLAPAHTHIEKDEIATISDAHRECLRRHGTLNLDPVPDMGGADPYNWPAWKMTIPDTLNPTSSPC
jgi:hypothetical protein